MSDSLPPEFAAQLHDSRARSHALHEAMSMWAKHGSGMGSGGPTNGYGELNFTWREGEGQERKKLTLWADLDENGRPVIRVEFPPGYEPRLTGEPAVAVDDSRHESTEPETSVVSASFVQLRETGLPTIEPNEECEACGVQGTVGRAVRFTRAGDIHEMHRFCAACWPEQQARYQTRWNNESEREHDARRRGGVSGSWSGMSRSFESATWDGVREYIEGFREYEQTRGRAAALDMRRIADELFDERANNVGHMPFEVESFIRRHTSRTIPPNFPDD